MIRVSMDIRTPSKQPLSSNQSVRPPFDRNLIPISIQSARKNWGEWRDVFEHGGTIATNPLLADPARFGFFCKEYSVGRTIRCGTQNEFRLTLIKSIPEIVQDDSGNTLDKLEGELRPRFGTYSRKGRIKRMVSVLSKVSAFVRPERFVAWDTFAKKGVNLFLRRSAYSEFRTYAEYLEAFDDVWDGQAGELIRGYASVNSGPNPIEREARFLRRVLDLCLMLHGGRKWRGF